MNLRGKLVDFEWPLVMGILNVTPDSFYDGGKSWSDEDFTQQAAKMLEEGAGVLDIGAASSRPGAEALSGEQEAERLLPKLQLLITKFPEAVISVDTCNSYVAKQALKGGAHIINDISGGKLDKEIFETVAQYQAPMILMHMQGTPQNMQANPAYKDVVKEVIYDLSVQAETAHQAGVHDVILDPGFGFGKTVEHNYQLLNGLDMLSQLGFPILAGVSRKSMINKVLSTTPATALNGTTAVHMIALQNGAQILRVHDVKEAVECVKIWKAVDINS